MAIEACQLRIMLGERIFFEPIQEPLDFTRGFDVERKFRRGM